jgi:hypothetical protein
VCGNSGSHRRPLFSLYSSLRNEVHFFLSARAFFCGYINFLFEFIVLKMSDPLSLARIATMKGATVVQKGDDYLFGSQSYPIKVETCFRRSLASTKAQYYTLKDVIFFMQNTQMPNVEYRRAVVKERCLPVLDADKDALISYLTGEVETVPQMNREKAIEIVSLYTTKTSKEPTSAEQAGDSSKASSKVSKSSGSAMEVAKDSAPTRTDDEKAKDRKRKLFHTVDGSDAVIGKDGFVMASADAMKASKHKLMSSRQGEVSVADRASSLRNTNVDFSFALKNFNDHVMKAEQEQERAEAKGAKAASGSSASDGSKKSVLPAMKQVLKPIIIVPSAYSSVINSTNAKEMLADNSFIPLEQAKALGMERVSDQTILRKIPGSLVELQYKIIDNPVKLAEADWSSVVAVFATGQLWQFKGWKWSDPRQLFANVLGVHLCMDDIAVDENILQWNCKVLKINRSKRHSDAIAMNQFWGLVDSFVKLHRPEIQKIVEGNISNMK